MSGQDGQERFEDLYTRYYRAVYSLFRRRGLPHTEAQDLSQSVFVRVLNGLKAYRGEAEWSWIQTIAYRTWLNYARYRHAGIRSADVRSLDELPQFPVADPHHPLVSGGLENPEQSALRRERERATVRQRELLKEEIKKLPARMRECLQLRLYGNLKYREIGVALGISIDTVKSLLFGARQRLIEKFGPETETQLKALDERKGGES